MLVIQKSDGNYHVHAPFQDKKVMKIMLDQIKKAQKNWEKTNGK